MTDMDQYRDVFLAESADYLQQIVDGLLALEAGDSDDVPIETIFRGAHSLKGMSAAMGYERTADVTHKMESVMDRVRKGEMAVTPQTVNLMLSAVDLVRDLIDDESAGQHAIDPTELIGALDSCCAETDDAEHEAAALAAAAQLMPGESAFSVKVELEETCVLKAVRAYMVIKRLAHTARVLETVPSERDIEDERFDRTFEVIVATAADPATLQSAAEHVSEVERAQVEPVALTAVSAGVPEPVAVDGTIRRSRELPRLSQTQTVRVAIGHLDTLVDLVGELVILRSRLEAIAASRFDVELSETMDEMHRISTDLQYEIMQTRMVPVGNIFNRFPRMVRDLAVDLGKQVDFQMEGLEIELDRTVLDEIGDPLVHLLRNSIDHGIESASHRMQAGKPPIGSIRLSAMRERDHVAIVVSDDGAGIDPEKVWTAACERGFARPEERAEYTEGDILLFTCVPGFSTAQTATKISGRGVGMDVVKGKVEHLGGTIQIASRVGAGTDFILRLPLTLAIVQALIVGAKGQAFALPLSAVEEVYLAQDVRIETIDGVPVVIMRDGSLVPLSRLDKLLLDADDGPIPDPRSSIVLVRSGAETRALHVDALLGRREIVVKPLSGLFRDAKGYSGATILGDGRVMLILDPRTIFTVQEA